MKQEGLFKKDEALSIDFEEFWASGPWRKINKKEALRRFDSSVKTGSDIKNIKIARDRYADDLKAQPWKQPQQGNVWFNNWRDWVSVEIPHPLKDGAIAPLAKPDLYCEGHYCDLCELPHSFPCLEPEACSLTRDIACPDWIAARRKRIAAAMNAL